MADASGNLSLRREFVDTAIKAIALMEYKLKTLCTVESSSAWTETYYTETNADPTSKTSGGGATANIKGVPRLAPFPAQNVTWSKVSGVNLKYAVEDIISVEDELMNNISMIQRTLVRLGRGVAKAVDVEIERVMGASYGQTYAISAGNEWDSATIANRAPIFDILSAIQKLRAVNIDALQGNGYLVVNGTDYTNLISNSQIMNNPTFKSADVVSNGVVGELVGLKIMVTEAVTADCAYVVVAKEALTWKEVKALTVEQISDPGVKTTIRAYEIGQCQIPNANGVCKITNTRK